MASNTPAPEAPFKSGVFSQDGAERSVGEWNPTAETVRPVRGRHRHRVLKQRGGFARSSTVLGVGVIAAVGAGGIATAQSKPAVSISLPDSIADSLPDVGSLMDDGGSADETSALTAMGATEEIGAATQPGTGEALRSRILQQAEQQQAEAEAVARAAAENAAAAKAAAAAKKAEAKAEAEAKAKKKAEAEAKAKKKAEAEAKAKEKEKAKLAKGFVLPTSSYTITATFGQSGPMWSSGYHTGLDMAAPTGTPAKAVTSGTIKSAGWHSSYGYNIVLKLSNGTEVMYAHLSSMSVSAGQKVGAGETIGRVGSTGNSSGSHLHLEVKTGGGSAVDPLSWMRSNGLNP